MMNKSHNNSKYSASSNDDDEQRNYRASEMELTTAHGLQQHHDVNGNMPSFNNNSNINTYNNRSNNNNNDARSVAARGRRRSVLRPWAKINKANDALKKVNYDLKISQVVVVGDQSSGKSSTLEHFAGVRGFLPRGDGIVTKTPIELRLVNNQEIEDGKTCFTFQPHTGGKVLYVPEEVDREIRRLTNALVKRDGKGVSDEAIVITIESNQVPDITLIDLPGLVSYSRENPELPKQIEMLVDKYAKRDNTTILAICENRDIANAKGLAAAARADPMHERTMGIITKCDVSSPGDLTGFKVVAGTANDVPKLGLGWWGVVNPHQAALNNAASGNNNLTLEQSAADCMKFFEDHDNFKAILPQCGHANIIFKVQEHIFGGVPQRRLMEADRTLRGQVQELEKRLADLKEGTSAAEGVHCLVQKFCDRVAAIHKGENTESDLGADLLDQATTHCADSLNEVQLDKLFSSEEIGSALRRAQGFQNELLVQEKVVRQLVGKSILQMQEAITACAAECGTIFAAILETAAADTLAAAPRLHDWTIANTQALITEKTATLRAKVKENVDQEASYIAARANPKYMDRLVNQCVAPVKFETEMASSNDGLIKVIKNAAHKYSSDVRVLVLTHFVKCVNWVLIHDLKPTVFQVMMKGLSDFEKTGSEVEELLDAPLQIQKQKEDLQGEINDKNDALRSIAEALASDGGECSAPY